MSIFYFHPQNSVAKKLADLTDSKGFAYTTRAELDLKLQRLIGEIGFDLWPTFHTVIGSLAGSIDLHIPLDPDDELDSMAIKTCKSKAPWSYVKVLNGPKLMQVVGYCSSAAGQPYAMSVTEQAQRGLTGATFVPRAL